MPPADLIVHDADVRTMDAGRPRAQAVAVRGARIVAVGSSEDVLGLAGPRTERIDAEGATVLPGIIDAHNHVRLGANPEAVSLTGARDLAEIRDRIAADLDAHPDLDWIEGEGWNDTAIPDGRPTAAMIDDVCAGRPAWLFSYDVHTVWLNTAGLRRWDARFAGAEVPFGRLETDPDTGRPTGWVHDFAVRGIHPRGQRALERVLPGYAVDARYRRLVSTLHEAVRFGITSIVEPQNGLRDIALFERARDEGELRSRLSAAIIHTPDDAADALDEVADTARRYPDRRLRLGPVKLYIDDVIEPHTAAMLSPYANAPACSGHTFWEPDDFARVVVRLEELGLQAFVHSTGDRGIRTALDGFAAVRTAHGPRDTRHQIVHVECLDAADLPRFAELGVVACMQPRHCSPDITGEWRQNVGPERERLDWAMRSLASAGAPLAFSSDWNVAEMDPLVGIYTALTRADLTGAGAWNAGETFDLDRTLQAYTLGAAWANFAEPERGSLEEGKLADLVVLSGNLHSAQPQQILDLRVTHTVIDGEVAYRAS